MSDLLFRAQMMWADDAREAAKAHLRRCKRLGIDYFDSRRPYPGPLRWRDVDRDVQREYLKRAIRAWRQFA